MTILYSVAGDKDMAEGIVEKLVALFEQRLEELDNVSFEHFIRHIRPDLVMSNHFYLQQSPDYVSLEDDIDWTIQNICKACDYLDIDMDINIDLIKNKVRMDINTEEAIREAYNSLPSSREINFDGKRATVRIDIEKE